MVLWYYIIGETLYRLSAIVEKEDELYVSHCVELGVSSQGKNVDEALKNLKEACQLYLKHADKEELEALSAKKVFEPLMTTITV